MNQKINFESNKSVDDLNRETLNYFQTQGFKLVDSNENSVRFERGSVIRNMVTFNPLKWKSTIIIKFNKNNVIGDFEVNTIHQIVTLKEKRLWKKFISNYQKSIETGESLISENRSELRSTKISSLKYIGYALIGAIIFGIPSGIIAYLTGIDSILIIGGVSGALTFMKNKTDKENEEDLNLK